MYSLNVPVPGRVAAVADGLRPALSGFERVREDLTLVVKRLGDPDPGEYARVEGRARRALEDLPPFEARVTGIDVFAEPASGSAPVVYLAVAAPGLALAHERLCDAFPPVADVEGTDYVPHVTLARGGDPAAAERLAARDLAPVTWTVTALVFWDADHGGEAGRVRLPA